MWAKCFSSVKFFVNLSEINFGVNIPFHLKEIYYNGFYW